MRTLRYFIKEDVKNRDKQDIGWGWGYVVIPPGHPAWGLTLEDAAYGNFGDVSLGEKIDLDSKWSRFTDTDEWPDITSEDNGSWIIGFDTKYNRSTKANSSKEWVEQHTIELMEHLNNCIKVPEYRVDVVLFAFCWCWYNTTEKMFRYIMQDISRDWEGYLASKHTWYKDEPILWFGSLSERSQKHVSLRIMQVYNNRGMEMEIQ